MLKPLCGLQQTGKFFKRWEHQTTLPATWETCMQVKKQQLELDMEKWTGSKLGKEYVKAVYCHPSYLTYMQSKNMWNAGLDESQAGTKTDRRNINNLRHADDTTLMAESAAAAAKSLQSCPTLCDPIDGSPPGFPVN